MARCARNVVFVEALLGAELAPGLFTHGALSRSEERVAPHAADLAWRPRLGLCCHWSHFPVLRVGPAHIGQLSVDDKIGVGGFVSYFSRDTGQVVRWNECSSTTLLMS